MDNYPKNSFKQTAPWGLILGDFTTMYTLLQKKRNFSEPIFPGDSGSLTVTLGRVHFAYCYQEHWQNEIQVTKFIYLHSSQNFTCCVSFEEECIASIVKKPLF